MIEMFQNIKLKKVKRQQIDFVVFNRRLVKKISIDKITMFDYIFFRITGFLYERKEGMKSRNVYGRITDIREKAIQINYTSWFPKSQITEIFKRKERIQLKLIKFYEEK
jgi:hypothetical protein